MTPTHTYLVDTDRGYIAGNDAHPALDDVRRYATRYATHAAAAAALHNYVASGTVRSGIVIDATGTPIM